MGTLTVRHSLRWLVATVGLIQKVWFFRAG
jgi:hypothetical protein